MNGYFATGIAAAILGLALGAFGVHELDANHYDAKIAATQAAQAKALAAALDNQQAAEQKVAAVDQQFTQEVTQHADDVLTYRAQLASGAQRMRVHVASCAAPSEGASATGSTDGAPAVADLAPAAADGVAAVAGDDQREIDKLTGLQQYVRAMQEQGYIASGAAK